MPSNAARNDSTSLDDVSITVVIVNYRTADLTRQCLAALKGERSHLPKLRAVVVDGASQDRSAEVLAMTVAEPGFSEWVSFLPLTINGGFGWANNQAILSLAGNENPPEFVYLLNPDAEVLTGAIAALVRDLRENPQCAAAGSQLLNEDGSPAASAFRFPSPGRELLAAAQSEKLGRLLGISSTVIQANESADVDWVTGASVMFRMEALRDAGLFDDGFFLYFEEVELLHRMTVSGWTVRHVPQSQVMHIEGASTGLGAAAQRLRPAYWYQSRRRYFALTSGPWSVLLVNLAWLVGRAARMAISPFRRLKQSNEMRFGDLLRFGTWPPSAVASVPEWDDKPGQPPAWMSLR